MESDGRNMYAAYARIKGAIEYSLVTLHGEIFMANKGLIELMVEKSQSKHPDWEFRIERMQ